MPNRLSKYFHFRTSQNGLQQDEQEFSRDGNTEIKRLSGLPNQLSKKSLPTPIKPEIPSRLLDSAVDMMFQHLWADQMTKSSFLKALLVCKQWARIGRDVVKKSNKVSQLPDEILLEILKYVRDTPSQRDSSQDLCSCIETCNQWYRVGMPLLYEHFILDVSYQTSGLAHSDDPSHRKFYEFIPSARFYSTTTRIWSQPWVDTGIGFWIHSLSVEIHFDEGGNSGQQKQSINAILDVLPHIRTFSLRAAPLRRDSALDRNKLIKVIHEIPSKIQNFELDTQGRDISNTGMIRQENTFCRALSRLLPQLHNLRLRLSTLCSDFLFSLYGLSRSYPEDGPRSIPNLKSLSIFIASRDFHPVVYCCMTPQWNTTYPPAAKLTDKLQHKISHSNDFSGLISCSIICIRQDMSAQNTLSSRLICKTFDPEGRGWQKRAYLPYDDWKNPPEFFRTDRLGKTNEDIIVGKPISEIRNFPGWQKSGKEMDAEFEGKAGWITDALGARHPSSR